jgi:hypothetical protein
MMFCQECTTDFQATEQGVTSVVEDEIEMDEPAVERPLKVNLESKLVGKVFIIPDDDAGPVLRSKAKRKREVEVKQKVLFECRVGCWRRIIKGWHHN